MGKVKTNKQKRGKEKLRKDAKKGLKVQQAGQNIENREG